MTTTETDTHATLKALHQVYLDLEGALQRIEEAMLPLDPMVEYIRNGKDHTLLTWATVFKEQPVTVQQQYPNTLKLIEAYDTVFNTPGSESLTVAMGIVPLAMKEYETELGGTTHRCSDGTVIRDGKIVEK